MKQYRGPICKVQQTSPGKPEMYLNMREVEAISNIGEWNTEGEFKGGKMCRIHMKSGESFPVFADYEVVLDVWKNALLTDF